MHQGRGRHFPAVAYVGHQELRLDDGIGEEYLVERGVAVHLLERMDLHAGLLHVEDEIGQALMLGHVPVGARQQEFDYPTGESDTGGSIIDTLSAQLLPAAAFVHRPHAHTHHVEMSPDVIDAYRRHSQVHFVAVSEFQRTALDGPESLHDSGMRSHNRALFL